jgi:hypothetical protein
VPTLRRKLQTIQAVTAVTFLALAVRQESPGRCADLHGRW